MATMPVVSMAKPAGEPTASQRNQKEHHSPAEPPEAEAEWEYEYSTTETETYYLTLDMSYPEFKDTALPAPHHSRSGYYKGGVDEAARPKDTQAKAFIPAPRPAAAQQGGANDDDNDADGPEPEVEVDSDVEQEEEDDPESETRAVHPSARDKADDQSATARRETKGRVEAGKPPKSQPVGLVQSDGTHEIQIIDLHADRPVISFQGRVFQGQWAEVVGTELLFSDRHDHDASGGGHNTPPPALRSLDDGVDVLGALSSRILTTEKELRPRAPATDTLAQIRREWNIHIPRRSDRSGRREQQSRFLENLMALKMQRGETDHVTVQARDGEGKNFKDLQHPDYQPRNRKRPAPVDAAAGGSKGGRAAVRRAAGSNLGV